MDDYEEFDIREHYANPAWGRNFVDHVLKDLAGLVPVGKPVHFEVPTWNDGTVIVSQQLVSGISFDAYQIYPGEEQQQR